MGITCRRTAAIILQWFKMMAIFVSTQGRSHLRPNPPYGAPIAISPAQGLFTQPCKKTGTCAYTWVPLMTPWVAQYGVRGLLAQLATIISSWTTLEI